MSEKRDGVAQKSGAERRRWPRANAEMSIAIALDGAKHEAKLRDISRAGVCFYLERSIPLMSVLSIALDLPDASGRVRKVRGQGAVVRCERISPSLSHWEIAVFVHDMPEADRAALDAYVRTTATV